MVNPVAVTTKENFAPGMMFPCGDTELIDIEGGGITVIVWVVSAESPEVSVAVMVKVCVPTSPAAGTQEKFPPGSKSFTEAVERDPNESYN